MANISLEDGCFSHASCMDRLGMGVTGVEIGTQTRGLMTSVVDMSKSRTAAELACVHFYTSHYGEKYSLTNSSF